MKKLLLLSLILIGCRKKVVPPPEEAKPVPVPVYSFKIKEYYPVIDEGVGSTDSVVFYCVSNGKILFKSERKMTGSNVPLSFFSVDSVKQGDVIECTTTAIVKLIDAKTCTFKIDSAWVQNKSGVKKLSSLQTYSAPVVFNGSRAVVSFKRNYTF